MKQLLLISGFLIIVTAKAQLAGFTLTGNPENTNGATWMFQNTINGVAYDLRGILYKPAGAGNFPAVIVNHGTGGNANQNGYSDKVCKKMVTWGYVSIATNYAHSGGVPCGSPGLCDTIEFGASQNNFLRAMKCWDILASLAYTDTNCIATFGHSRGAFLTTGLAGTYPGKFSCAGHTAGGVGHPTDGSYPTSAMVNTISKPYILHHGTADSIVNISYDNQIDQIFTINNVTHNYYIYQGLSHPQMSQDTLMYSRTKAFFNQYICGTTTGISDNFSDPLQIYVYPNPSENFIQINSKEILEIEIVNMTGQLILSKAVLPNNKIDISFLPNGIYLSKLIIGNKTFNQRIIKL